MTKVLNNAPDEHLQLVEKMQEILEVSSEYHRMEIIMALPEILPPSQHDTIATFLHRMLGENKDLTAIVDCFGNLSLSSEMVSSTQLKLIQHLPSFKFSVMPAVVEYLLSSYFVLCFALVV